MKTARIGKSVFAAGVACACVLGALSATAGANIGPAEPLDDCICPAVYAPVICRNGNVYENSCVALCHGQTGCKPHGTAS